MSIDQISGDTGARSARPSDPSPTRGTGALRSKSVVRVAGLGVLMPLLLTLLVAAPADAASLAAPSGQVGNVWVQGPMITAWDLGTRLANGTTFYTKNYNIGGITVGRSPSTYEQRVTVVTTLQRWSGSWLNIQSKTRYGVVRGSGTASFPAWTYSPTNVPNNSASYRVVHVIYWYDSVSGQLMALTGVVPTTFADNRCSTSFFRCTSYTDGLNF